MPKNLGKERKTGFGDITSPQRGKPCLLNRSKTVQPHPLPSLHEKTKKFLNGVTAV